MLFNYIENENVDYLDGILLEDGLLKVLPAIIYRKIKNHHLALYGHHKGFYSFPTIELADWIKEMANISSAIEIGAGHGALARYLGIPATDSKIALKNPLVKRFYDFFKQPVVSFPDDIIEMESLEAIQYFRPRTVIAQWVTHKYNSEISEVNGSLHGVDENFIIENVDTYIVVGNENVHGKKPVLQLPHKVYKFPWLFSRTLNHDKNVIYVWKK
jgi:hypothetical protein